MDLLTRFGLARSRFTIATMISLFVAGVVLYPNFPKREDPVVVIRTAVVSALFPGMAPERMENLVAIPIERKIRELAEVKDIRTLTTEGSLTVYVDLKDEISDVDAMRHGSDFATRWPTPRQSFPRQSSGPSSTAISAT